MNRYAQRAARLKSGAQVHLGRPDRRSRWIIHLDRRRPVGGRKGGAGHANVLVDGKVGEAVGEARDKLPHPPVVQVDADLGAREEGCGGARDVSERRLEVAVGLQAAEVLVQRARALEEPRVVEGDPDLLRERRHRPLVLHSKGLAAALVEHLCDAEHVAAPREDWRA